MLRYLHLFIDFKQLKAYLFLFFSLPPTLEFSYFF